MFSVELIGQNELNAKLENLEPALQASLRTFMVAFTVRLLNQVKTNVAALFRSTGPLYQSLSSNVDQAPGWVQGSVFTRGIPYAKIQEEGGRTAPHVIVPRTAAVLAWEGPSGLVFAKRVNHPGSNITGRSYAGLALTQLRGEFEDGIRDVVSDVRATVWDTL